MPNHELLTLLRLIRTYMSTGRVSLARTQLEELIDHVETETKERPRDRND